MTDTFIFQLIHNPLNSRALTSMSGDSLAAEPKSASFIWPLMSIRMFSGFMSLQTEVAMNIHVHLNDPNFRRFFVL